MTRRRAVGVSPGTVLTVRNLIAVVVLVFCWCALWGEVSVANVASGTLISVLLVVGGLGNSGQGGVRLMPLLRLVAVVAGDLLVSTASVARATLAAKHRTDESIIAVSLPPEARSHLLLMTIAITVTPGTAVVDIDRSAGLLYLHVLSLDGVDQRERLENHVRRLADLAAAALPVDERAEEDGAGQADVLEEAP